MKIFTSTLIMASALLATSVAHSADMPMRMPAPIMMASAPPPAEDFSGWYLRGDVGSAVHNSTRIDSVPQPTGWTSTGTSHFDTTSSHMIGAGIGYAWNSWFRTDLTLEYRGGAQVRGRGQGTNGGCCSSANDYSTSLSSVVGMANAYIDLGTWAGITPFVGAGIGYANNSMGTVSVNGINTCGACVTPTMGHMNGATKGNMAWALMAGLGYDVSRTTKLEMGYRFMNLGNYNSGTSITDACGCASNVLPLTVGKLTAHDFRIGMRWMLNEPAPAMAHAPMPLMRKN